MSISFEQFIQKAGGTPQDVKVVGAEQPTQPAPPAPSDPSLIDRVKSDFSERADAGGDAINADQHPLSKLLQVIGQGAGFAGDVGMEALKSVTPKPIKDAAGSAIGSVASSKPFQEAATAYDDWKTKHPEAAGNLEASLNIASILPAGKILGKATGAAGEAASAAKTAATKAADEAFAAGTQLRDTVKVFAAKKSTVGPQLEESAKRLFLDGTSRIADPVAKYDAYVSSAKKALTDIKADPPLAQVGEGISDAFKSIVGQRKAVGKTLGDELKTIGKYKVSIAEPKTTLLAELKDSGLSYNPKTNALTSFQGTKFAPQEMDMLRTFFKGVQSLGDNPSVSSIDNYIAKTRTTLAFTKGKAGITDVTNAERIINGTLGKLRESINPAKNGNKALSRYWEANDAYHRLSNFVEEGEGFLGKVTQSGDFAKDASLAKSAVQSMLNNGKKDWLIKLEGMTGYRAIDDTVLALQAMKDAGDFRGLSLLQTLADGAIPTSQAGWSQKLIDWGIEHASKAVAGSPEEQTRAFLKSLGGKSTK